MVHITAPFSPDLGAIIIYQTKDGQTKLDVKLQDETVWLSLTQMAVLFERDKSVISRHMNNIFSEGELDKEAVIVKNATTVSDGKTYQVDYFNLDAIILVGYRVNSKRGTQFRHIGSFLFLIYLQVNGLIDAVRFDNKGLVALALLVAASAPTQKDVLIRLIVNLLAETANSKPGDTHG